jgi:hypothetical protein
MAEATVALRLRHRHALVAAALPAILASVLHANAGQTPSRVRVERAVQAAVRLAYQGGKAGVVLCDLPRDAGPELAESRSRDSGDATVCEELNASLALKREGDVLHLRSSREPAAITDLLNRRVHLEAVSDVPAIDALTLTIVPAMRGRASVASSRTAGNGPLSQPVSLEGGSTTFLAALDAVVRQTSGLVWYVAFSPDGASTAVGLVGPGTGGGVSLLPGPARRPSTP